jgi:RNA polymerase sigma-70 factor (ECF subfamily)
MRKKELKVTVLRDSESGEDYVDVHHPTTTSSPDDLLIRAQQNEALRELMMQLAPTHRRILEMRFLKELSYAEIAENLNISVGTVKSKVFRATQLLREILRNSPPWNEV